VTRPLTSGFGILFRDPGHKTIWSWFWSVWSTPKYIFAIGFAIEIDIAVAEGMALAMHMPYHDMTKAGATA
jgi:hypothetical protein